MTTRHIHSWQVVLLLLAVTQWSACASRSTKLATEQEVERQKTKAETVVEAPVKEIPMEVAKAVPELPPPPKEPEKPYLLDVLFDFDQYALRMDAVSVVEVNAKNLGNDKKVDQIVLEGRGDEIGTSAYNIVLGEKRARAVKRYLENLGVSPAAITVVSYGKDRPLCREHNPDCWQKNRSVRFTVK